MKIFSFNENDLAVINYNVKNGLPYDVGKLVEIVQQLETGNYDYYVRFQDGSTTNVKELELNKIDKDDSILQIKIGDGIIKPNGEECEIRLIDYLHRQVEVEFADSTFEVVKVDSFIKNKSLRIALIGLMRSGKDTVADYLTDKYSFTRYAFGDELKRYYHELFGETESKPREGYQWFGQTMRQRDRDIWVRKCFDKVHNENKRNIVISDLRQPNEYKKCKEEGYIIVKVQCDDGLRMRRIMEKHDNYNVTDLKHETESHVDTFKYDYIINNDGSLEDLYKQVDEIVNVLKK